MEAFAMYLVKSASWLTGFTLVYFLFLRNERYFILKRIYLIFGIIVSITFPLITFNYSVQVPALQAVIPATELNQTSTSNIPEVQNAVSIEPVTSNYGIILLIVYLSGIIFFAYRVIVQVKSVLSKIHNSIADDLGKARIIRATEYANSFSFFNYVFIHPSVNEAEMEPIINHELVHIRQKHWLDLILVEIICLLQWVNPFTWLYSRFIRLNHEYIADQVALELTTNPSNYKAALLNQMFRSPVINLSNSFNYSTNKTRFEMMKKMIISPWRRLKVLIVLPVFAIVFYAFAIPEYHYEVPDNSIPGDLIIYEATAIFQKQVKGIVLNEQGQPVEGVAISSTGSNGNTYHMMTRADGRFSINNVKENASLLFFNVAYKRLIIKPDFTSDLTVKLEKDPDYAPPVTSPSSQKVLVQQPELLVVVDGEITDKKSSEIRKELGYNYGMARLLRGKEATDKYGDKGANGAIEITTRKKALEMGIKTPFPRLAPEDYPTFQNKSHTEFRAWVAGRVKYPEEAKAKKAEGWVSVSFVVELDGSVTNVTPASVADPLLSNELIRAINSSPKWEPPKNPNVDEPFRSGVDLRFRLPDQVSLEAPPFIIVEEMPLYPGGPEELLNFIKKNLRYPEGARRDSIEGKVIVRFIINTEGNTEGFSVLKGVNPLLDAEAVRVISTLTGFKPGRQGGKSVNVWYMAPVSFSLKEGNITPKQ